MPLSSLHFVTLIHPFLTPSPLLSSPPLLLPSLLPPLVSSHSQPEDSTTCYQVKKKKEEEEDKKNAELGDVDVLLLVLVALILCVFVCVSEMMLITREYLPLRTILLFVIDAALPKH